MEWNFDMSEAPKGYYEDTVKQVGKNTVLGVTYISELIIAAGNDGVVTISKWLPKEERWNMFTKDTPPKAWFPFPKHPDSI